MRALCVRAKASDSLSADLRQATATPQATVTSSVAARRSRQMFARPQRIDQQCRPSVPLPVVIDSVAPSAPAGPIAATSATTEVVDAQNLIPDINTLQTSASTSVTSTGGINLVQPKEVAVSLPTGTPTVIATNPPVITESSVSSVAPPPGAMNDGMILTPPSLTGNPSVTSGTGSTATGGGT
eukprot:gene25051-30258_t